MDILSIKNNLKTLLEDYTKLISESVNSKIPSLIIEYNEKAMLEIKPLKNKFGFNSSIYQKESEKIMNTFLEFLKDWAKNNSLDDLIKYTSNYPNQDSLIMLYKGVQLDLKYEDVKIEDMLNPNTSSTNISTSKSFNKQDNLKRNVQLLCETLNDAGFRNDGHKWQSGIDPKSTFGGGICFDKSAFNYLKTNGYLDKNICWKCGDEPITKEFSFNIGNDSSIKYNICKNCFKKGKKTQNVIEGKDSANCYIATVCYGDINAPELNILRYFRDNHLKNTNLGSKFVDAYYCASPSIAEFLKNKKVLNLIIKKLILNPIVDFVKRKKTTHNNGYK